MSQLKKYLSKYTEVICSTNYNLALVGPIDLPIEVNGEVVKFSWYVWLNKALADKNETDLIDFVSSNDIGDYQFSSVLLYGDVNNLDQSPFVRFHSICHTGDIFGSKRCDCGEQLEKSLDMIVENGSGALFYLANHEGRGIGLFNKALTYILQENDFDTVDANLELGLEEDSRSYSEAITILKHLTSRAVTLITNNPQKINSLREAGVDINEVISLWTSKSHFNEFYLKTKVKKSGHLINN
ncbi:GTP cyclohydrolase II [Pseudalkalibacillus hwajinpoensis]|uniref:GTP cyclohydrolase II n=1 Tax=Guptibacillus hwajinpoensis TaxID=208199 RepID=A0A4U1MFT6_9BACL|nr:GTP cyclohydrolase II [Pseudalkalibacillus hwajinpoensis]TKD69242.1 GTP cyclohydrolase II [Pseudalkalibacillus hwajinpoensis]